MSQLNCIKLSVIITKFISPPLMLSGAQLLNNYNNERAAKIKLTNCFTSLVLLTG